MLAFHAHLYVIRIVNAQYAIHENQIMLFIFSDSKELIAFGSNQFGQLGRSSGSDSMPQKVEGLAGRNISQVTCGDTFTVVYTEGKDIYMTMLA